MPDQASTHITGVFVPEYFRDRPEALLQLTRLPSAREVLALIHDLGRPLEGELRLRATHYFHEPSHRDYDGPWHRDGDEGTQLGCAEPPETRSPQPLAAVAASAWQCRTERHAVTPHRATAALTRALQRLPGRFAAVARRLQCHERNQGVSR